MILGSMGRSFGYAPSSDSGVDPLFACRLFGYRGLSDEDEKVRLGLASDHCRNNDRDRRISNNNNNRGGQETYMGKYILKTMLCEVRMRFLRHSV